MTNYKITVRETGPFGASNTLVRASYRSALEAVLDHATADGGEFGPRGENEWYLKSDETRRMQVLTIKEM